MFLFVSTVNNQYMKKGYHDYIPVVKEEKEEVKKKVVATHEPKYITSHSGIKHMISDERGMVVADSGILQFGATLPSMSGPARVYKNPWKMSTKNYIKYNGKF